MRKRYPAISAACALTISLTAQSAELTFNEHLASVGNWKEFQKGAQAEVNRNSRAPAYYHTMLATAQQKSDELEQAEKTLRLGISRHPNDPLCYTALAQWLATRSNNPHARAEAIALLEKTCLPN